MDWYYNNIEIFAASGTITWIFNCIANDEISIYTSRYGAPGKVETPEGISSFLIEYKGINLMIIYIYISRIKVFNNEEIILQ